jgi:hypothetical protein
MLIPVGTPLRDSFSREKIPSEVVGGSAPRKQMENTA